MSRVIIFFIKVVKVIIILLALCVTFLLACHSKIMEYDVSISKNCSYFRIIGSYMDRATFG